MSGSVYLERVECGNSKIYYLGYDGKESKSLPVNEPKDNNWWKSRLILIPIASSDVPPRISDEKENAGSGEVDKEPSPSVNALKNRWSGKVDKTPSPYQHVLKNICESCKLLDHILWRNVRLVESRFESRFRSHQKDNNACFLQFHTMQAPALADLNVTLAMVDHIGISNDSNNSSIDSIDSHEQIVAFINIQKQKVTARQEPRDKLADKTDEQADKTDEPEDQTEDSIVEIFKRVVKYYIEEDREDAGVTPMLFIAAFLKWYGFEGRDAIAKGFKKLTNIDKTLVEQDEKVSYGNLGKQAEDCRRVNKELTSLNQSLIGLRSRVNYVAESARSLKSHVSTMKEYIVLEIQRDQYNTTGQCSKDNIDCIVDKLENLVFVKRDGDKFDMIERAMQQYQTDIKSLKAHLAINIGLVSNLYAQLLTEKAARDSAHLLLISGFGAILLPMTFACIFLTTPIFKFRSTFHDTTYRGPPAYLFLGISVGLVLLGFVISFIYSRRRQARDQKDKMEDGKKQGKKGCVKTRICLPKKTWWRKLQKTATILLECGTIRTAPEPENGTEHFAAAVGKESTTKEPEPSSKKVKPDSRVLKTTRRQWRSKAKPLAGDINSMQ